MSYLVDIPGRPAFLKEEWVWVRGEGKRLGEKEEEVETAVGM